jgi:hypothetical protein
MTDDLRIDVPFETLPPRLKDLINNDERFTENCREIWH